MQADLDAGVGAADVGDGVEEGRDRAAHDHAEADPPAEGIGELGGGVRDGLEGGEGVLREGQNRLTGRREADPPAGAVEQLLAQLRLQLGHLGADAGLADVQSPGCRGEGALVHDRGEVAQLMDLHIQER